MVCAVGTAVDGAISSSPRVPAGRMSTRDGTAPVSAALSRGYCLLVGRVGGPHDMQDDCELPRERHLGFPRASSPGNRLGPVTETVASYGTAEDRVCCLVQAFSRKCVSPLRNAAVPADFTGFVSPRCQSQIGPYARGFSEA